MITRFQQQLEEEFGKLQTEEATKEESQIKEDWKQSKEFIKKAAEQTIRYQPKPDRREWFDDECRKALEEKNAAYKKWIDRTTIAKRLEYERLRKIDHKTCKNRKRTYMYNRIRNIKGNIKGKQTRNAHKEVGSLKAGFQPHTDFCRGTNNEILSTEEEIKTSWKTYFQDLSTTSVTADQSSSLEANYLN
jgi:hypothetical protein